MWDIPTHECLPERIAAVTVASRTADDTRVATTT